MINICIQSLRTINLYVICVMLSVFFIAGVDGAKELADALGSKNNTTLAEFRAADCQIGDEGVKALCKALRTHPTIKVCVR